MLVPSHNRSPMVGVSDAASASVAAPQPDIAALAPPPAPAPAPAPAADEAAVVLRPPGDPLGLSVLRQGIANSSDLSVTSAAADPAGAQDWAIPRFSEHFSAPEQACSYLADQLTSMLNGKYDLQLAAKSSDNLSRAIYNACMGWNPGDDLAASIQNAASDELQWDVPDNGDVWGSAAQAVDDGLGAMVRSLGTTPAQVAESIYATNGQ